MALLSIPAGVPAQPTGPGTPPPAALRDVAVAEDQRRWDDTLRDALRHADASVRRRAVLAAGRLQDSTTVPALLPLLEDASLDVRREAAFALGQVGHRSARPALERALAVDDLDLRALALEALGKLGDRAATPAVVKRLADPSPRLRAEAAVALWRLADSTAIGALLARHGDPDPSVRWRVLYALEKVVAPERVVKIVASHLRDDDPQARCRAARTLGRQKSALATSYLLPVLRDERDVNVLVETLRAVQGIADSTSAEVGPALARGLSHPHPYVRVTAATALGERFWRVSALADAVAAIDDSLVARTRDADAATRVACARALMRHRTRVDVDLSWMNDDADPVVRAGALRNLALLEARDVTPLLLERLGPGRALAERMAAEEALGTLGDRSAAPALRAVLADTSLLAVAGAADALGTMGDSASVPALVAAFERWAAQADGDARVSIRDALRALAGRPFADSLERAHPAANAQPAVYPPGFELAPVVRGAVLHTAKGDIEWAFFGAEAPQTVKNFVALAERGYFDGLIVHRVVPDFVIQDGDPTGTGAGGPGHTIRCEYNRLRYDRGMVGMALSGKDTGGSQWFVTHSPQPHLDGRYTIFARVTRGMEVVDAIVQGDRIEKVELLK